MGSVAGDMARLNLWARQLLGDAMAENDLGVIGDVTTFERIKDRIVLDSAEPHRRPAPLLASGG